MDLVSSGESQESDQDRSETNPFITTNKKKKSNKSRQDTQTQKMERDYEQLLEDQKKKHEEEMKKLKIELD